MFTRQKCALQIAAIIMVSFLCMRDAMPRYPNRTIGICPEISAIQSAKVLSVDFDKTLQKYIARAVLDAGYEGFVKRDWLLVIELNDVYPEAPTKEEVSKLLLTLDKKHSDKVLYEPGAPPRCVYSSERVVVQAAIY